MVQEQGEQVETPWAVSWIVAGAPYLAVFAGQYEFAEDPYGVRRSWSVRCGPAQQSAQPQHHLLQEKAW